MRVKNVLPLILLAVGALFLLSSCDQILDAIYANNTINVTVNVSSLDTGYANTSSYIQVVLSGATGATATAGANTIYPGSYSVFSLPFNRLPNGDYTITAYYYGYHASTYYQYGPQSLSLSMPYNGSTTASVTFSF